MKNVHVFLSPCMIATHKKSYKWSRMAHSKSMKNEPRGKSIINFRRRKAFEVGNLLAMEALSMPYHLWFALQM